MPRYLYKKFELFYNTHFNKKTNFYEIHGTVTLEKPTSFIQEFQTENLKREQGIIDIKNLMERFIDLEWEQLSLNDPDNENKIKINFIT